MDKNLISAVHLLRMYTAGRFDIWILAGNAKRTCRQHVMTVLLRGPNAKNVPQAKCGVFAIQKEFEERAGIDGSCVAVREKKFITWCESVKSPAPRGATENETMTAKELRSQFDWSNTKPDMRDRVVRAIEGHFGLIVARTGPVKRDTIITWANNVKHFPLDAANFAFRTNDHPAGESLLAVSIADALPVGS